MAIVFILTKYSIFLVLTFVKCSGILFPALLINNAGNNIPEHFTKVKTKNMEYLVKINTIATFNLAQLCALKMIKTKNRKKIGGAIVNINKNVFIIILLSIHHPLVMKFR